MAVLWTEKIGLLNFSNLSAMRMSAVADVTLARFAVARSSVTWQTSIERVAMSSESVLVMEVFLLDMLIVARRQDSLDLRSIL